MVLKGRLGLETARIPHSDRHGLLAIDHGHLTVENGCLRFVTAGGQLDPGDYLIPHQGVSILLLGPGSTVSHDALRLLSKHGTALVAIGENGVRCYTAPPLSSHDSLLARRQTKLWADEDVRIEVARTMYAWRLGEILPRTDIETLRGIEGARMKETYRLIASRYGVRWKGRRYDRSDPTNADEPNQAINHAATVVEAAATIAVYATGTIAPLGFIHEDAGIAFILDIADLFRDTLTLPLAFEACSCLTKFPNLSIDRLVRKMAAERFRREQVIPKMIDRIKLLFSEG